jgi:hypothetical protein
MQDRPEIKIQRRKRSLPAFEKRENVSSATNKGTSNAIVPNGQKDPINLHPTLLKHALPMLFLW